MIKIIRKLYIFLIFIMTISVLSGCVMQGVLHRNQMTQKKDPSLKDKPTPYVVFSEEYSVVRGYLDESNENVQTVINTCESYFSLLFDVDIEQDEISEEIFNSFFTDEAAARNKLMKTVQKINEHYVKHEIKSELVKLDLQEVVFDRDIASCYIKKAIIEYKTGDSDEIKKCEIEFLFQLEKLQDASTAMWKISFDGTEIWKKNK